MLQMQLRKLGHNGSALILVLGAVAVVAVITLEIYRRSALTQQRSTQAVLHSDVDIVMQSIRSRLQNPETCEEALRGADVSPGARQPVTMKFTYDPGLTPPQTEIKAGSEVTKGIMATAIGIELDAQPDMATQIKIGGALQTFVRYRARLQAVFDAYALDDNGIPRPGTVAQINRTGIYHPITNKLITNLGVPFLVWVNTAGRLTSCFGQQSAGSMCNDMGGYFFAQPPGGKYDHSCRQSQYTVRLSPAGASTPIGSCRVARVVASAASCSGMYGYNDYEGLFYSQDEDRLSPGLPADRYLCMQCE